MADPAVTVPHGQRELIGAIQRLSMARTVEEVREVVRTAARRMTGADGATFVLRDGTRCWYVDEDAIEPLWKGQKFPLTSCISGWAMLHRRPAAIPDIYADDRIPHDAYRPTFVTSLAMVPIRSQDPVGAIGNYWAAPHEPTAEELELLQALTDSTAVAMENVRVLEELEARVAERTAGVQALHDEVQEQARRLQQGLAAQEDHVRTLAHEVRSPLAAAEGLVELLLSGPGLPDGIREDLTYVRGAVAEALRVSTEELDLAKLDAGALVVRPQAVDLEALFASLAGTLKVLRRSDDVALVFGLPDGVPALRTDPHLLGQVLRNLVTNALKVTVTGEVRVTAAAAAGEVRLVVADTGPGIAPAEQERIFEAFAQTEGVGTDAGPGTGLGLPLVRRFVAALGGRLEVVSAPGAGAAFTVVLPA